MHVRMLAQLSNLPNVRMTYCAPLHSCIIKKLAHIPAVTHCSRNGQPTCDHLGATWVHRYIMSMILIACMHNNWCILYMLHTIPAEFVFLLTLCSHAESSVSSPAKSGTDAPPSSLQADISKPAGRNGAVQCSTNAMHVMSHNISTLLYHFWQY